jgi:nucleotide-binding universal stress UspA family protein
MKTIRKIMAAIDFSEHSKSVLEYAGSLVASTMGEMVIVNVINKRDMETLQKAAIETKGFSVKGWVERQQKERRLSIQDLIEETNLGQLSIKIVFREGLPFRELLKVIDEEGADLLVMGIKGRSNLREFPIGSTAEKVCQRCPVPILSVRSSRSR